MAHAHAVSGNPPVDKVAVGARIKAQRMLLGMKQITLAEKVGVRAHTVLRYEKGELLPGSEVLGKIADALGETSASLLYGQEGGERALARTVERDVNAAVADFLSQMGDAVSPEHAAVLRSIDFGGMVPDVMAIARLEATLRATTAGRAVPARVIAPPPLPEGSRRLPKKPRG